MSTLPRRTLLGLVLALLAVPGAHALETKEAETFIRTLGAHTIEALDRAGKDHAARVEGMRSILDQAVDIPVIARIVLGRGWRQASEAQRQEYLDLFRAITLGILAQRFSWYSGSERFEVTGSRPAGGEDAMVGSRILYTDYPPLTVDWRVRAGPERLMIVDVVVEGVSLILTNRSEVEAIVGRRGIEGLLEDLRGRLERLEAEPGRAG